MIRDPATTNEKGTTHLNFVVFRGSSFISVRDFINSRNRNYFTLNYYHYDLGFRVVSNIQ
jgi:formylglycine-generating enzyme required for sulfatase activity